MIEVAEYCASILEADFVKCSDGIDNDMNGYTDCQDFSCRTSDDPNVVAACQESIALPMQGITPDDQCSDGIDNDNDGFVDCQDWDCSWNPAVTVCPLQGQLRVCEEEDQET